MCTVLLPPGDNPIAVNKYIISYQREKRNAWEGLVEEIVRKMPLGRPKCGPKYNIRMGLKATGIEIRGLD